MTLERNKNEVIIKLSSDISDFDLQELIDFIQIKEVNSKATEKDVEEISDDINRRMMENYLNHRKIL